MTGMQAPDAGEEVRARYAAVRRQIAGDAPVTVLHIGAAQTAVASGDGPKPDAVLLLDIGWQRTSGRHFEHMLPTAMGLEGAIAAIEDEVMRARGFSASDARLCTTDAGVREVARAAGFGDGNAVTLPLDTVERTFGRLAALAQGMPAPHVGLPADAAFAATLLILREFMHHLHFQAITVLA